MAEKKSALELYGGKDRVLERILPLVKERLDNLPMPLGRILNLERTLDLDPGHLTKFLANQEKLEITYSQYRFNLTPHLGLTEKNILPDSCPFSEDKDRDYWMKESEIHRIGHMGFASTNEQLINYVYIRACSELCLPPICDSILPQIKRRL